tara:strand:+ start:530 stop:1066 length:537 start_codon:yes stop_codon:yes gene_type:complete
MKKILFITIFSFIISSEIKNKSINTIKNYYSQEIQITDHQFSIPKKIKKNIQNHIKQKFYRDKVYYWVININGIQHYAILDNTIGKTMPITFLVIFNENQEVVHSEIIKYREGYGGEISGQKWLSQFVGMQNDSLFKFGKEIDGITGATISVKSFTKGISKLSLLLPYVINYHNKKNK